MDAPLSTQQRRWTAQLVAHIERWTPHLWSLRIDKPQDYQFAPGHYVRLGLPVGDAAALWRPYSIVSAPAEAQLEILVTLVPNGAFTSLLAAAGTGRAVMVESTAMGFFLESQLTPGDTLWMLATGSGLGPYVSLLREGSVLARYRRVVLVHSVRLAHELAYASELRALAARDTRLRYLPVVTREAGVAPLTQRIPQLIESGAVQAAADAPLDPDNARVMVCGNPDFTAEMRRLLNAREFKPCRRGIAGSMLFENYW